MNDDADATAAGAVDDDPPIPPPRRASATDSRATADDGAGSGPEPAADADAATKGAPGSVTEAMRARREAAAQAGATDSTAADADEPAADFVPSGMSEDAVVALIAERDEYLDHLQRLKAEFDNARRRNAENADATRRQAAADLVEKLLPVLDSCEAAVNQGVGEVEPVRSALLDVLVGQGLTTLDPSGELFDPERHEAVMHEEGDGEPTVAEVLRTGYAWNDRVIRPPMVRVRG